MRGKWLNLLLFVLVIIASYYVFAGIAAVTLDSPTTGANSSSNDVTFTCSATPDGDEAIQNISIGLNFSADITINDTNTTPISNSTTFTVLNIPDGRYFWNCLAANSSAIMINNGTNFIDAAPNGNTTVGANFSRVGATNQMSNSTITVDTVAPSNITLVFPNRSGDTIAAAQFTNGSVTVVWKVADALMTNSLCNVTVNSIVRATNVIGVSNNSANFTTSVTGFNSLLTNTWQVTCSDYVGNDNSTGTTSGTVTITDTVAPYEVTTLSFKGTRNGAPNIIGTEFDYGKPVTISNCNGTENVDYFNSNATIDIRLPDVSSFKIIKNDTSGIGEVEFTDTSDLGSYLVRCIYRDGSGNFNSTNKTFTIHSTSVSRNPAPLRADYRNPISSGSKRDFGELNAQGIPTRMAVGGIFSFSIDEENHQATLKLIKGDKVTIEFRSDPINVEVSQGQSMSVDIDKDGTNDVEVTFENVATSNRADLTFKRVSTQASTQPETTEPVAPKPSGILPLTKEGVSSLLITLIIIFIVLLIIYSYIKLRQKGSRGRGVSFSNRDLGSRRDQFAYNYHRK
ncbi:MAG: hypothetical protein Q8R00_01700 [Candidatus Nanoarchaeia archaeon]|nr:hypothetical protein [Candidatus Nanoarchaeia archaeon]